jgi:uncharacterized protein (TIGR02452 family)
MLLKLVLSGLAIISSVLFLEQPLRRVSHISCDPSTRARQCVTPTPLERHTYFMTYNPQGKASLKERLHDIVLLIIMPDAEPDQTTLDSWLSSFLAAGRNEISTTQRSMQSTRNDTQSRERVRRSARRRRLAATAQDTLTVLPGLLSQLPNTQASASEALFLSSLPPLQPIDCPRCRKATIRILNNDTFNAAISLKTLKGPTSGRVAVLNMASHVSPGGGWLRGAIAQEEALCYRSSLALSLQKKFYPWKQRTGLYTADVVVIRSDMSTGHKLLVPEVKPPDLPVVSVLSIAALRQPQVRKLTVRTSQGMVQSETFADPAARSLTKDKMRLCLRMAAQKGHRLLVLGALGCGAFRNPKEEVARCWMEVFRESEFQGGWWEEVWFAVYDLKNEGNFEVFDDILGGLEV